MFTYKDFYTALLFLSFFGGFGIINAQVGINTTTPRTTLEVGGNMSVSETFEIGTINPLNDTDTSTFLIQSNSNYIKSMDVSNPTGGALGYIQEYKIINPELDWVRDFNTGINSKDYVLIVISASFDKELNISSSTGAVDNSSLPYTATFIQGNKWHIIADYPMVANQDPTAIGTWTIQCLIFSKDLSKQLGTLDIPMLNASTGAASNPIID